MEEKMVLRMENITMQFGGVLAVNNLSLDVPQGQIVARENRKSHPRPCGTAGHRPNLPEHPAVEEHDGL